METKEKIPCIMYTPELWATAKPLLESWGYKITSLSDFVICPLIILNLGGYFGRTSNVVSDKSEDYNRELVTDVEEFLERAARLKGFIYKKKQAMTYEKKLELAKQLAKNKKVTAADLKIGSKAYLPNLKEITTYDVHSLSASITGVYVKVRNAGYFRNFEFDVETDGVKDPGRELYFNLKDAQDCQLELRKKEIERLNEKVVNAQKALDEAKEMWEGKPASEPK